MLQLFIIKVCRVEYFVSILTSYTERQVHPIAFVDSCESGLALSIRGSDASSEAYSEQSEMAMKTTICWSVCLSVYLSVIFFVCMFVRLYVCAC